MGCSTCSSGGGLPKGCRNNGSCGVDGCSTYPVFDWLANMQLPSGQSLFDIHEVRFKNGRKEFFRNTERLSLSIGDTVVVDAQPGHDLGVVSMSGELVRLQLRKKNVRKSDDFPIVLRKANQTDLDLWKQLTDRESETMLKAREISQGLKLEMKISDVEFQGDGQRATFYYTAEKRIDFRQLIREYASLFKIRVEMRHIGSRQEASRLGGIGSCGRELCCSTWLSDFRSVSTSAARYQQLALNPQKLAGQCGKLKCCLNYELDSYLEALNNFPDTNKKLQTEKGSALFMKMDIFNGYLWYAYRENSSEWHKLKADDVKNILHKNKSGESVAGLEEYVVEEQLAVEKTEMSNVEYDALDRFDKQNKSNNRRRKVNTRKKPTSPSASKEVEPTEQKTAPKKRRPQKRRVNSQQKNVGDTQAKAASSPETKPGSARLSQKPNEQKSEEGSQQSKNPRRRRNNARRRR